MMLVIHFMRTKNPLLWQRAIDFLYDTKDLRTHIIHDSDADGISSGLQLFHGLKRLGATTTTSTRSGHMESLKKDHLAFIKETFSPQALILCDHDPKSAKSYVSLRELFPDIPLLIIDHHAVQEYDDAIFLHPALIHQVDGAEYCTSKLVYDLLCDVVDVDDLKWLACIGIIGDMNYRFFPQFIEQVAENEGVDLSAGVFNSAFSYITDAIECCAAAGESDLLDYIDKLKECSTFQEALKLGNPRADIKLLVEKYAAKAEELADKQNIIWLLINEKVAINGWVATMVSAKHPDKLFCVYRIKDEGFSCSVRLQNAKIYRVHLGELLSEICPSLGGRGGGHAPAAGAWVPYDSWNDFKKQVTAYIGKEIKNT